jgi:PIN domain nuclease of toxin-antitoxin system
VNLVYNSNVLIAYMENETGADEVYGLLSDQSYVGFIHTINLCEIFYHIRRKYGEMAAQEAYSGILKLGLIVREDMDEAIWQAAARLKAEFRRVSLADCICASLANQLDGEMVMCDRHEIQALNDVGACKARFIR